MAPESSKQAKKRGKKQKIAIEAAFMNDPNVGVRLSEPQGSNVGANHERERVKKQKRRDKTKRTEQEDSNGPLDEISTEIRAQMSNPSNDTQGTTKTRGPTRCSALPVESGNRLEVELNENRQPIGDNSVHLSTFVGCLTRKMVSILFGDWRRVPNETKEYYWQVVKQKFTFKEEDEDDAKTYVLQKMGILARSNKSKLGSDLKKKQDYIEQSEWEVFVKTRSTKKWKGNHQQKKMVELDNEDEESDEGSEEDEEESDQEKLGSQKENVKSNETPSTTPQSHNRSSSHLVKGKCKLLNWQNSKELVAMGKLSSDDPNEVVHGKPLGEGVSRVWVEMAYQPKALLFRPCFGNEVIEDVIGSTTAWPTVDIRMID